MRLIGQDVTITIADTEVTAYARSIDIDDKANTVDVRGIGDSRKKLRPTYGESTVTADVLIEGVPLNPGMGSTITIATSNPSTGFTGIVTDHKISIKMDDASIETITIECDADQE